MPVRAMDHTDLLIELVAASLELDELDPEGNFIEEGGHSLLAVSLAETLQQDHGLELNLETLYRGTFRDAAGSMTPLDSRTSQEGP